MFNFFRNKKKKKENPITDVELQFFKKIVEISPLKYHYLYPQINDDFLIGYKENILNFKDSYTLLWNGKKEKDYLNKKMPNYFILKNIKIWNLNRNNFLVIELDILKGIIGGFKSEITDFSSFDFSKFDLSELSEKHFENKELDKVLSFFNEDEEVLINENIEYTYEIELKEGIFYFFDELSDGDVIALDNKANVFLLFHDPYRVERIFSKTELIDRLKNNTLKIDVMNICNSLLK